MADDNTGTPPDDDGTPPPTDPPPDWAPPTKDEVERMQRALAKANAEARDWRTKHKALADQHGTDADKAAREQAEAAEKRYKPVAIRAAARAAFIEAGLQGGAEVATKLVRQLDLDAINVDDDGNVTGLDDQITAVKVDFPTLFTPGEKPKPPRLTTGDRPPGTNRPKRSSDILAAAVLGG